MLDQFSRYFVGTATAQVFERAPVRHECVDQATAHGSREAVKTVQGDVPLYLGFLESLRDLPTYPDTRG